MRSNIRIASLVVCLAVAVLLVSVPVWSQDGKGPGTRVEVGPSGAPASPQAAPSAAPSARPAEATKRPQARNPFVPPGASAPAVVPSGAPKPPPTAGPKEGEKKRPAAKPLPPQPTFQLAGIVQSAGFLKAMFVVGTDVQTVKVGDKVQGYTVKTIDVKNRQVIVTMESTAFRLKLPRDTPYGSKSEASPGKGSGGPTQGAPLPPPPAPAPAESDKGK